MSGANSGAKYGSLNVFSMDSHKVAPSSTTPWPFVIASSGDGDLTPLLSDGGCGLETACNNMNTWSTHDCSRFSCVIVARARTDTLACLCEIQHIRVGLQSLRRSSTIKYTSTHISKSPRTRAYALYPSYLGPIHCRLATDFVSIIYARNQGVGLIAA